MKYEGVSYNEKHLSSFSKKAFVNEIKHHFKDDPKAKEKMDELYKLIAGKEVKETESTEELNKGSSDY